MIGLLAVFVLVPGQSCRQPRPSIAFVVFDILAGNRFRIALQTGAPAAALTNCRRILRASPRFVRLEDCRPWIPVSPPSTIPCATGARAYPRHGRGRRGGHPEGLRPAESGCPLHALHARRRRAQHRPPAHGAGRLPRERLASWRPLQPPAGATSSAAPCSRSETPGKLRIRDHRRRGVWRPGPRARAHDCAHRCGETTRPAGDEGFVLARNQPMLRLAARLGFAIVPTPTMRPFASAPAPCRCLAGDSAGYSPPGWSDRMSDSSPSLPPAEPGRIARPRTASGPERLDALAARAADAARLPGPAGCATTSSPDWC